MFPGWGGTERRRVAFIQVGFQQVAEMKGQGHKVDTMSIAGESLRSQTTESYKTGGRAVKRGRTGVRENVEGSLDGRSR